MIIDYQEISNIRKKHAGQKIVFCSGVFDLTHAGHVLFFEDCKKHGDILVVGIGPDADIHGYKGLGRPILNEQIRLKTVASFKSVDYCFLNEAAKGSEFLVPLKKVFAELRPDFYVFNKDAQNIEFRKIFEKDYNSKLIVLNRWCPPEFENISTTNIIEKIIKNYGQEKL